uniref:Uncharacterized protein n=1 Tax=Panagrolaimus sp. ES5 TaxID=591445 RepID=A0AC34F212_9BILA
MTSYQATSVKEQKDICDGNHQMMHDIKVGAKDLKHGIQDGMHGIKEGVRDAVTKAADIVSGHRHSTSFDRDNDYMYENPPVVLTSEASAEDKRNARLLRQPPYNIHSQNGQTTCTSAVGQEMASRDRDYYKTGRSEIHFTPSREAF